MKDCYVAGCSTHINQPPGKMPLAALSDGQAVVSECLLLLLTNEPLTLEALFFELLHSPWVLHVVGTCHRPRLHCIAPRTFTPKALPVDLVGPCTLSQPLIISPSKHSLPLTPLWYKNGDRGKSGVCVRHQRLLLYVLSKLQVTDVRRILQCYAGTVSGDNS